jgi:hypothetical protein
VLRSPAWRLHGLLGSEPVVPYCAEGVLAHTTEAGPQFEFPLCEVTGVTSPWYYFGEGVKPRVGGRLYGLSFVNHAEAERLEALDVRTPPAAAPGRARPRAGGSCGSVALPRRRLSPGDSSRVEPTWPAAHT